MCSHGPGLSEQRRIYLETAPHAVDSVLRGLPRCTDSNAKEAESHIQVRCKPSPLSARTNIFGLHESRKSIRLELAAAMGELFCFLNQALKSVLSIMHLTTFPNSQKQPSQSCFCAPCVPRRRRKRGDTCAVPFQSIFLLFYLFLSDFMQKMAFPMHLDKLYISFEGKVIAALIIYSPQL